MPVSKMKFIKRCAEFIPKEERRNIPSNTRGIYLLLQKNSNKDYSVIYVGMARGDKSGIHGRLNSHSRSKSKGSSWTHFSLFEVHDNISIQEIEELEGLLRHIYRYDKNANPFNQQRQYKKLVKVRDNNLEKW
ncbi:MAG: GIY-YIG nuclease family protein [Ignavibacteriae bacterium]|nr:GIY-YIG nuclease family protein [Ignavibacteriota bacterium]